MEKTGSKKHKKPIAILLRSKLLDDDVQKREQDCGDCACAVTPVNDVFSLEENSAFQSTKDVTLIQLSRGWRGLYLSNGANSLVVLNQAAYNLWKGFNESRSFSALNQEKLRNIQEMAKIGLLVSPDTQQPTLKKTQNTQLSAWLHITDRCNLRCAYCYLPHKREDMTLETGKAAIAAIFREARDNGYKQVKFKYSGGEALLCFPLVVELHQYAWQLAAEYALELDGVILSNGTLLTEEIITTMQGLGLRLMISLDGMAEWHDSQRPYAGGRGTFVDVAESVELALAHNLIPDISITVSGRSAEGLPEIIAWVLERELPFSLNFYRQNDFSVSHEDLKLEEEKIINGMLSAFKVIEYNLPERSLLSALVDRANLSSPHLKTCSVGDSYLVFNQHGQVSKCQMKMDKSIADVHTGNLLQVVREDKTGIQNLSVEEKEGCRDCEWKYWCTGGCPLESYRVTGQYDAKSPNCNIYKTIFPEVLRLEGLRLLKEAGELVEV